MTGPVSRNRRIGLATSFLTVVPLLAPGSGELGVVFRSAPGQLAAAVTRDQLAAVLAWPLPPPGAC